MLVQRWHRDSKELRRFLNRVISDGKFMINDGKLLWKNGEYCTQPTSEVLIILSCPDFLIAWRVWCVVADPFGSSADTDAKSTFAVAFVHLGKGLLMTSHSKSSTTFVWKCGLILVTLSWPYIFRASGMMFSSCSGVCVLWTSEFRLLRLFRHEFSSWVAEIATESFSPLLVVDCRGWL